MQEGSTALLRCVNCQATEKLELAVGTSDAREIRTGALSCTNCGSTFEVADGIVHLLRDESQVVALEAAGLERFAAVMRADGWDRARVLALPYEPSGYWTGQRRAFEQLCDTVPIAPGSRILDVGSNTCWASNLLARQGHEVVALDIALTEMQGLRTGEWFMDDGCPYFERVLGSMFDLPFADASFDEVFCCEVLHHNGPDTLRRTLEEIHRVLKPGGRLLVINEPLRVVSNLQRHHGEEVAEFDGNENVYFAPTYLRAARRAGFGVHVREPDLAFFTSDLGPWIRHPDFGRFDRLKLRVMSVVQRSRVGRRAYLAYRLLVRGDVSLHFVGTKR